MTTVVAGAVAYDLTNCRLAILPSSIAFEVEANISSGLKQSQARRMALTSNRLFILTSFIPCASGKTVALQIKTCYLLASLQHLHVGSGLSLRFEMPVVLTHKKRECCKV